VDLNVWVRYLLSIRGGRALPTASRAIVETAQTGRSASGLVQLIVSYAMLSRLEDVLVRLGFPPGDSSAFCSLIGSFARRGPAGVGPHLVLGGGTSPTAESRMPVYNPYDPSIVPPRADDEDGRVLDTAIAGRADILATYNVRDFQAPGSIILEPGRVLVYQAAHHRVIIMHPQLVARYLRTGELPATTQST
jgi:hypothetical protein